MGDARACDLSSFALEGFDQCGWKPIGDQCLVSCEILADPSSMDHFMLYNASARPSFQGVIFFKNNGSQPLHCVDDTFVCNCAGYHKPQLVRHCLERAIAKRDSTTPTA